MKAKRLLCGLLTAAMVMSLAACGAGGTESASSVASVQSSSASTASQSSDASVQSETKQAVTLSAMVTTRPTNGEDLWVDLMPKLINERFPHITVQVDQLPTDQYKSTVKMKFASGQGPDFFSWWPNKQAEPLVEAGYVKDLSELPMMSNFYEDILEAYTFNGKPYAVPLGMSFLTTWYNKDHFAKAGIDKLPENWDEFIAVCEKLKAAGFTPITVGDKDSFVIQFGVYQLGASAVYHNDTDFDRKLYTGETKFTDPKWVDTMSKYGSLYQNNYVIKDSLGLSQQQSRQSFIDGQASMIFDGSFGYVQLTTEGAQSFERGMFCLPGNNPSDGFVYNLTPAVGLFVNAKATDDAAVMDVVNYWFTEGTPLFDAWVKRNDNISSYKGVEDPRPLISEYLQRYDGKPYIYNLNNAWPDGVSDALCTKFQEVITGSATADDVCNAMQSKFEQVSA